MNKSQRAYWDEYVTTRLDIFSRHVVEPFHHSKPETPEELKQLVSKLETHTKRLKELSDDLESDGALFKAVNDEIRKG